jgi:hypothetical protein
MLPTSFPQANFTFKKPNDMTDEQCMDLHVWRGEVPHDDEGNTFPAIISCWKFSKEDLEEIQNTGCVWLSITGNGMPPVSIFTENPF